MPTEELLGNDDARTGDIIPGGVLTRRGTIEEGNTASDYTELEKEKGYSV